MRAVGLVVVLVSLGCATGTSHTRRADALPAGCEVEVLHGRAPTREVRSLGEVTSRCTGDAMSDAPGCLRALQDQACALGGDVIWSVTSSQSDEALTMRAAVGRYR